MRLDQQSSAMNDNRDPSYEENQNLWRMSYGEIGPSNHGDPFDQTVIVIFVLCLIVILWRYFYQSFILLRVRLGLARADPQDENDQEFDSRMSIPECLKYTDPPPTYEEVTKMSDRYPLVSSSSQKVQDRTETEPTDYTPQTV